MTGTWPTRTLRVYFGIVGQRYHDLYIEALSLIEGVCGVQFIEVFDPARANIVAYETAIDGPGNEVALTQEPMPGLSADSQLWQHFDSADLGSMSDNELLIMFLHEDGHFLGREHSPPGVSSVMSPVLDILLAGLTAYDEAELQAMYGLPVPVQTAPSPTANVSPPAAPAPPPAPEAPTPMATKSVVAQICSVLSHLPGEVSKEVNLVQLEATVEKALGEGKDFVGILDAVSAAASVIFPDVVYLRLAIRMFDVIVHLYQAVPAKAA